MVLIKTFRWVLVIYVLQIIATILLFYFIPNDTKIPTHWDMDGQIDSYSTKSIGLLLPVGFNTIILSLFLFFPKISPKYREHEKRYEKVLPKIAFVLIMIFTLLQIISAVIPFLKQESIFCNPIFFLIGFLIIFLGNILPKVPNNFFIGIRTPWTLSDNDVWIKTHRLGGYTFVIAGILLFLEGFQGIYPSWVPRYLTILAMIMFSIPVIYSFVLYLKINR